MGITEDLQEAGDFLKKEELCIVSHNDTDGIASAALVSSACEDGFLIRIFEKFDLEGVEELAKGRSGLIILDMGSDRLEELSRIGKPILVLDHHPTRQMATNADIRFINPHLYGLDGAFECCTSTLAYYLIREKNRDIKRLIIALSGIIGDKQHLGVRGPNVEIFERADRELRWEKRSILSGRDLRDALLSSIEPFIEGISGSEEGVERFLEDLHLDGGKRVEELSLKEQEKLNSALVMVMLRARARPEVVKRIVAKRYRCDLGGLEFVDELSRMLNGCGKEGKGGLALSSLFCEDLIAEAIKIAKGRESRVLRELNHLELKDFGRLRCFWSDHSSDIATVIANYLSSDKPVFGLSKRGVIVKISARAPKELVAIGLNLSPIMEATKKLEGNGGGHSVAAGGWVPLGREEDFLRLADELVGDQIG